MKADWLMGYAPLAQWIAEDQPGRPARHTPAPARFSEEEQAKRRKLDVDAPKVEKPQPAAARSFKVGDRVHLTKSTGNARGGWFAGDMGVVAIDYEDGWFGLDMDRGDKGINFPADFIAHIPATDKPAEPADQGAFGAFETMGWIECDGRDSMMSPVPAGSAIEIRLRMGAVRRDNDYVAGSCPCLWPAAPWPEHEATAHPPMP